MTFIQISRNSIKMHMYDTCDLHLPLMTSLYFSWHHCLTAYRATALTHSKQIDNLRKWSQSCSVVFDSLWSHGLYSPWSSLGQNTGVGSFSLLQVLFPNQGLNPGLPHCRWILYQLSHKGSPNLRKSENEVVQSCPTLCNPTRLLHPWNFPGKSTGVGCHFLLQGIFSSQGSNPDLPHCKQTLFTIWATREAPNLRKDKAKWRVCNKHIKTYTSNVLSPSEQ